MPSEFGGVQPLGPNERRAYLSGYVWPRLPLLRCERDQARLLDPAASADPKLYRRVGTSRRPTHCPSCATMPKPVGAWTYCGGAGCRTGPRTSKSASRAGCGYLPPQNPFDFNLALVLAGLCEVVGHLQAQPGFRATPERLVETDRHLGR